MICDNCDGKGYTSNPKLYQVPSWKAYEMGYDKPVKCKKCGGTGFIISNAKEVIEDLNQKKVQSLSINNYKRSLQIKKAIESLRNQYRDNDRKQIYNDYLSKLKERNEQSISSLAQTKDEYAFINSNYLFNIYILKNLNINIEKMVCFIFNKHN